MRFLKMGWDLVRDAGKDWQEDKASELGAAMAFYSILSLAPLLVIAVAIAALVFGEADAKQQLAAQMNEVMGSRGAEAVSAMIEHAQQPAKGTIAALLGVATLLFGASGVFGQLQSAMNTIWEIEPKRLGIWGFIRARFLSFTMVLGTGFLLLISLVLSAWISSMNDMLGDQIGGLGILSQAANTLLSFALVTVLFALIFRMLPDTDVDWRDVWVGAVVTAILFTLGKYLIGLYLGTSSVGSAYGAAGSLVVLVVWIYYSAQILFFGAELTQVYARRYGSRSIGERRTVTSPAPKVHPDMAPGR